MLNVREQNDAFASFLQMPCEASELDLSNATLIDCIKAKIEMRSRKNTRFGKQFASTLKILREMENEFGCIIYPNKVSELFWSFFIPHLESKGLKPSSMCTIISQIKATIEWASKYGAPISQTYNECTLPKFDVKHISLTPDDISRIYHFNIDSIDRRPQIKRTLERVKDMFCLMCNLGLRYSDAKRLCKDHFNNEVVHIMQQKTKMYAHINIPELSIHREMTYEILEKYNCTAPYSCDNTEFDKRLHELIQYCKFNDIVKREIVIGGRVQQTENPKWKLITSHSARRTFVVCNVLRGIPHMTIMRATGHKTFSAFQKYLCYNDR